MGRGAEVREVPTRSASEQEAAPAPQEARQRRVLVERPVWPKTLSSPYEEQSRPISAEPQLADPSIVPLGRLS